MAGLKRTRKRTGRDLGFLLTLVLIAFGGGCAAAEPTAGQRMMLVVEADAADLLADCKRLEAFVVRASASPGVPASENGKRALSDRAAEDPRADAVLVAGSVRAGLSVTHATDFTGFSYDCG